MANGEAAAILLLLPGLDSITLAETSLAEAGNALHSAGHQQYSMSVYIAPLDISRLYTRLARPPIANDDE